MKKIFVIIFGVLFVGIGIFVLVQGKQLAKRCTVEVVGTVIDIVREESTDSDGDIDYTYYPVIQYHVGDRLISQKSSVGSNSSKYSLNQNVDILYNPEKENEYIIKGDKSTNFIGIIFIVLGAIVVVVGIKDLFIR